MHCDIGLWRAIEPYVLAFIPMFVAVDAIGNMPFFLALTKGMDAAQRRRTCNRAVATATVIALLFIAFGQGIFHVMGFAVADFRIAGGVLLLVLSAALLIPGERTGFGEVREGGIFPLATPLLVGPAVMTTSLVLVSTRGVIPTVVAILLNMAVAWTMFRRSEWVMRILRPTGVEACSHVANILLAAIAVMMIRRGIMEILGSVSNP